MSKRDSFPDHSPKGSSPSLGWLATTANLTDCTESKRPDELVWMEREFQDLSTAFTHSSVLTAYNPDFPLTLHMDASDGGIRATLSQTINGEEKPIAFFTKEMLDRETRSAP